jgi:heptosyltransferase III
MTGKRILIIRNDHLGDLILSLPVADVLKETFPDSYIAYLAAPGPAGVAELVDYVDHWILDSDDFQSSAGKLAGELRKYNFDLSIELKPSWRTAIAARLAGIKMRIGTSRRFFSFLYNNGISVHRRGSGRHQTDLDLELLSPFGIIADGRQPRMKVNDALQSAARNLVGDKKYIVIHPGSSGSAPNWPLSNYWILSQIILDKTDFGIVITGQEIFTPPQGCRNLGGKTKTIGELAGVIDGSSVFISGNTGPMHLADALGRKCLSFSIRHPDIGIDRWGPRRNIENVVRPEMYCHCRDLRHCICLETISPEFVFEKLSKLLKET